MHTFFLYVSQLIIATALVATAYSGFHAVVNKRTRRAVFDLNQVATENVMKTFLEHATHDQPVVEFAQQAFRAMAGELMFIDARIDRTVASGIPIYDLKEWNTAPHKDLPRLIEIDSKGVAVKFEHPGIWYEMVFTSRRGYGRIPVRRFMLAAVSNRVEEVLMFQQNLERNGS